MKIFSREFFLTIYIDVKFSEESIFRILGAIWQVFPDEILSLKKKSWFFNEFH